MQLLILLFGTDWILSKFASHVLGKPSASVSTTSVGILRIVEETGATVTECKIAMAESRGRIFERGPPHVALQVTGTQLDKPVDRHP